MLVTNVATRLGTRFHFPTRGSPEVESFQVPQPRLGRLVEFASAAADVRLVRVTTLGGLLCVGVAFLGFRTAGIVGRALGKRPSKAGNWLERKQLGLFPVAS